MSKIMPTDTSSPEPGLTRSQRVADRVTEFCGSWTFIMAFSALVTGWVILNSVLILVGEFDPYPYIFLNLVLTVVSTFQGPLIMMSQNRQMERDRDAVHGLHDKLDALNRTLAERSDRPADSYPEEGGHDRPLGAAGAMTVRRDVPRCQL